MDKFYAIVTGDDDAFCKMCMKLPSVIESVVNEESYDMAPNDTVINELRNVAEIYGNSEDNLTMAMAVYMLGLVLIWDLKID